MPGCSGCAGRLVVERAELLRRRERVMGFSAYGYGGGHGKGHSKSKSHSKSSGH